MKSLNIRDNVVVNTYTFELKGQDLIMARNFITGGKSLMKYIVNRYETYLRQNVADKGDSMMSINGRKIKFYPVFRWEGDDLILDNSRTFSMRRTPVSVPKCSLARNWWKPWTGSEKTGVIFIIPAGNLRSEADSVPR